jgi:predicted component of type VI protein secretion system
VPGDRQPPVTHLVYRGLGHAITARPLTIGREPPGDGRRIRIYGHTEGVSRRHCTVVQQDGRPVLIDTSSYGTFVDGVKIAGETELRAGQTLRVGTPGEELQVIACLVDDETPNA